MPNPLTTRRSIRKFLPTPRFARHHPRYRRRRRVCAQLEEFPDHPLHPADQARGN